MSYYVKAKSKKELNERLARGYKAEAIKYDMHGGDVFNLEDCPDGSSIKIFEKYVQGNPYAKAYGTLKKGLNGAVTVK